MAEQLDLKPLMNPVGEDDSYVPGERSSIEPPPPEDEDWMELSTQLSVLAERESSAIARSRALTVSALLRSSQGQREEALTQLREAAIASPRLGLCAELFAEQAVDAGSAAHEKASPDIIQVWEAAARQASTRAMKKHAQRRLLWELSLRSREAERQALLDRIVRAGEGDLALELDRVIARLAEKQSLSKMTYPESWSNDIALAAEALGGKQSSGSDEELKSQGDLGKDLLLQRAARLLREGDVSASLEALGATGIPAEVVLEFSAALHGAAPGGLSERVKLLWKLARTSNERRIYRELFVAALLNRDTASVGKALEQVDPSAGTLKLKERLFLLAFSGQDWHVAEDELSAVFDQDPIAAYALASPLSPTVKASESTENALLAQLAAALCRYLSDELSEAERGLAQEDMDRALAELKTRGSQSLLLAAITLGQSKREAAAADADALRVLSFAADSQLTELIRAAQLSQQGRNEEASAIYQELLLGTDPLLHLAACRGLLGTPPLDARSADQQEAALNSKVEDAALHELPVDGPSKWSSQLEHALLTKKGQERFQYFVELLTKRLKLAPKGLHYSTTLQLFASESYARLSGANQETQGTRQTLSEGKLLVSRLTRLSKLFEEPVEIESTELAELARSRDVGLRALSRWSSAQQDLKDVDADRLPDNLELTRLEHLQNFASALTRADWKQAVWALQKARTTNQEEEASAVSEQLVSELLIDLSELEITLDPESDNSFANSHFGVIAQEGASESQRRFALERLAELDERRKDHKSALMWRRALSEEFPQDLSTQIRLEELQRTVGEPSEATAQKLADLLPPGDRDAYRALLGVAALVQSDLRGARKFLQPMLEHAQPPLLALRGLIMIARERRDDELLRQCYLKLSERKLGELDSVAVHHELALIETRKGSRSAARKQLKEALERRSDSFVLRYLDNFIEKATAPLERGKQLASFAESCALSEHKVELWREAAQHFETAGELALAAQVYENILAQQPADQDAYEALVGVLATESDSSRLRRVYERRLKHVTRKTAEQSELLVHLSSLLLELNEPEEAKSRLEELLLDHPEHLLALGTHAELSLQLSDVHASEKSLIAMRQLLPEGPERLDVLRRLGEIYFEKTGQMEKAMDAYQDVLAQEPHDDHVCERLVEIYCKMGLAERAAQLQTQLIQSAQAADKKRRLALRLAEIYETIGKDREKAAATLERTRKAWPLDAQVLTASIQFLDRHGDSGTRGITLSRAEKDARRKLEAGSINSGLVETLGAVARLSNRAAEADACEAALASYLGGEGSALKPAGLHCLSPKIDGVLAPHSYPEPFRRLLQKTADAMDAAFSVDLAALGARPLTSGPLHDRVQKIAETIGWPKMELFMTPSLGARCLPVSRRPPRLLIGEGIESLSGIARDYLLLRAFKLQVMGVGALSRSRDEDRFAGIVALLHLFCPNWRPPPVDVRKVAKARALIEQGLARVGYDDEVPTLALEAIGTLSGQNEGLIEAPRTLANRACLVGVGDLNAVLEAMAAGEGKKLAEGGPSRFRFVDSHAEAKELLLFMTTSHFTNARIALGLVEAPVNEVPRAPAPLPPAPRPPGSRAPLPPRRPKPPPPKR